MANIRQERANAEVIKALSYIISNKLNNPRIKGSLITLTYCNVSLDFRHCKVGFSVIGASKESVKEILQKSEGYIKKELLSMVKLPFAPKLEFIIDIGGDNSDRVNELLNLIDIPSIEVEREDAENDEF